MDIQNSHCEMQIHAALNTTVYNIVFTLHKCYYLVIIINSPHYVKFKTQNEGVVAEHAL